MALIYVNFVHNYTEIQIQSLIDHPKRKIKLSVYQNQINAWTKQIQTELYENSRELKRERRITWYVVSNLSYMKRVMMLVFPTDWSPRNTSLYLARGDTTAIGLERHSLSVHVWDEQIWIKSDEVFSIGGETERELVSEKRERETLIWFQSICFSLGEETANLSTRTASQMGVLK